jgi:hypothetical protein
MSSGEKDLQLLISSLNPLLTSDNYVFATIKCGEQPIDVLTLLMSSGIVPLATFFEDEGMTIVINQCDLEAIQNQVPNLIASGVV